MGFVPRREKTFLFVFPNNETRQPRKGLPNDKQVLHLRMAEVRLTDKNILISHRDQSFIGLCKKVVPSQV